MSRRTRIRTQHGRASAAGTQIALGDLLREGHGGAPDFTDGGRLHDAAMGLRR